MGENTGDSLNFVAGYT